MHSKNYKDVLDHILKIELRKFNANQAVFQQDSTPCQVSKMMKKYCIINSHTTVHSPKTYIFFIYIHLERAKCPDLKNLFSLLSRMINLRIY